MIAVYTVFRWQGIADEPNKLSGESLTTDPHERMPLLVWVFSLPDLFVFGDAMTNKGDVNEGSSALHCYLDDTPVDLRWMDGKFERIMHPHGPDWTVWFVGVDSMGRRCVVKEHRQPHATYRMFYTGTDLVHDIWMVQMVNAAKHLWLLIDAFGIESDVAR